MIKNNTFFCLAAFAALALLLSGCGGGGGGASVPVIVNLNNATTPSSPVDLAIEVNGAGFRSAPGEIHFTQGSNVAQVVPDPSGWSSSSILVIVPSVGSAGSFTVPGSVTVTVVTPGGTSNGVVLDLASTPVFQNGDVQWATTTPLPTALRGHQAVPVEDDFMGAWAVVAGGNDGNANVTTVRVNTLAADGHLGPWTSATALPFPRAHHAMVVAHPGNSPVAADARFLYVIGGQQSQSDAPGGTASVFSAPLTPSTGAVGSWTQIATLPAPRLGLVAVVYNGFLYVVGGLATDGTPSAAGWSSEIMPDGSLGPWRSFTYPLAVSFANAFGFAGHLYVMGGDAVASTDPNEQGLEGISDAYYARVRNGNVGVWSPTTNLGKRRKKYVCWVAFGQVLTGEGVYQGSPGSQELERNVVQADAQLSSWNNITSSSNQAGANVYNAAHFVSPIRPAGQGPRFLLLGGQVFSPSPPGALTSTVYYNTAP